MTPILHASSLVSAAAVSGLVSAIWEGSILAVCVFGCLSMLPRLSAASRSLIWANVFLLLMLLHFVPSIRTGADAAMPERASTLQLDLRWSLAVAGLWGVLSIWRGTQLTLNAIRLHRLACRATPLLPDPALAALLQVKEHGDRSGRKVELCTSIEVDRPCVFGFFRPRILIPNALLDKLTGLELQQVVLHEMEHLRRGDDWTNLAQKIGLALFPLNPVLLWVDGRLCAERELACDDHVLRSGGARKEYAICLTRLAEYTLIRRSLSLVLGAWERQSELVRRVHRLLRGPDKSMSSGRTALVTGSVLVGVLGGAIVLAHGPRLISFVPIADSTMQARSIPAPAVQKVRFSQSGSTASPYLVKAAMPERPVPTAARIRRVRRRAPEVNQQQPYAPHEGQWIVLTEWSDSEAPPPVVFAVAARNQASYAALATPMGWLIIQI
jgi:beta-lactamase regulating signal transducer with metallopeptidase domain